MRVEQIINWSRKQDHLSRRVLLSRWDRFGIHEQARLFARDPARSLQMANNFIETCQQVLQIHARVVESRSCKLARS